MLAGRRELMKRLQPDGARRKSSNMVNKPRKTLTNPVGHP